MFRHLFGSMTILSLMMALTIQSPVPAQEHRDETDGRPQEEVEEAQEDYYEVWGASTKEPNKERPWSESFDREAKAQARLKELEPDYAKGGLMESASDKPTALKIRKPVKTVKRIKKAKDAAQGKTEERKVGDTLRVYAKDVEQAAEQVKTATERTITALRENGDVEVGGRLLIGKDAEIKWTLTVNQINITSAVVNTDKGHLQMGDLLICWGRATLPLGWNPQNRVPHVRTFDFRFPVEFAEPPAITTGFHVVGHDRVFGVASSQLTTTGFTGWVGDGFSGADKTALAAIPVTMSYVAIGKPNRPAPRNGEPVAP
jgi:hypothetical protein